jgi:ketosteroid isomerase-like protein
MERSRRQSACAWKSVHRSAKIGEGVFGALMAAIDGFTAVPHTFTDGGDHVVVLGRYGGTMKKDRYRRKA